MLRFTCGKGEQRSTQEDRWAEGYPRSTHVANLGKQIFPKCPHHQTGWLASRLSECVPPYRRGGPPCYRYSQITVGKARAPHYIGCRIDARLAIELYTDTVRSWRCFSEMHPGHACYGSRAVRVSKERPRKIGGPRDIPDRPT